ncbi:four helix bundle protein [Candidatus Uhrbacteria bacterium RIFCSPLOWO2_01_FULL_47_24]|uniref:Four helix bundle protein n=1 Tax=Candidatus Uhrbacteria bacterium RIFCSPLOWO2_01_FULL_47_24 TaxID=1802401 RepID=A0A1F7UNN6_9BACT|nr:MAG: four helix bundle protein [Candidatus Uhrbacteria bacterium RIFCSPHIGHO2_01_FULL_47_11]OGL67681.1 MAG: four helix bundle protein [Candidatus Uhrbacteria bacterium RIFCSPHIGHO2_02_FULL_46_47]OGL74864.1 MAG: four helix bundle protein [Candidatus Uhrbacteria bacterium RIFCSPHIGHO2_12_FULL_47_11]OGL79886.1 MAG: four helix bundle protein [Candidatus Uhrbacteria bacterium RIFCSPLOWO2_01_FULL_47_24]OGL84106.1 MAG: four helix bundle protein [Candidatus Uhrbacteria bacterium RIFCSPLOWO2_02_FULL_
MANIKSFKELGVWQKAHDLVLFIYKISQSFPEVERFGITSQLRRAAVSIAANIVEGFHRYTVHDSLHFYTIAQGSLEETRYHCLLAHDLGYIDNNNYQQLEDLITEVSKMLTAWIHSQRVSAQ